MTKKEQDYLNWLNEPPRVIKQNDDGSEYVPISCVQEDLLEGYKGNTKMELLRESYHSEGLSGIGRLHYKHPISGEWLFQDGSASIPFNQGMRLDFPSLSGHIMLSCAKKIGPRFGQKLNRDLEDDQVLNEPLTAKKNVKQKRPAIKIKADKAIREAYAIAVVNGDTNIVATLENAYDFN